MPLQNLAERRFVAILDKTLEQLAISVPPKRLNDDALEDSAKTIG